VSLLAVSAALLAAFVVIEMRVAAPLMPLRIFRLKTVAGANAVGVLLGAGFFAYIFIGTLYLQQVLGYSALKAGLAWLVMALSSVAFAGVARDPGRLEELRAQLSGTFTPVTADAADPVVAGKLLDKHRPRTLVLNAGAAPLPRPIPQPVGARALTTSSSR